MRVRPAEHILDTCAERPGRRNSMLQPLFQWWVTPAAVGTVLPGLELWAVQDSNL